MSNRIYVGTSGWNYDHWKEIFYASGCPKSKWLQFYAERFSSVEVNATFYRSMQPKTFENWRKITPAGFKWAVKANRYITHIKGLNNVVEPLQRFFCDVSALKEKLGPILFQLPPKLVFNEEIFNAFCNCLPKNRHCTIEARHPSWMGENALSNFESHQIAWCISDTAGRYPYLEAVTSNFIYIRLHGSTELYASNYSEEELTKWADKIKRWNKDTYVYFDNDAKGHAPKNALRLKELLSKTI